MGGRISSLTTTKSCGLRPPLMDSQKKYFSSFALFLVGSCVDQMRYWSATWSSWGHLELKGGEIGDHQTSRAWERPPGATSRSRCVPPLRATFLSDVMRSLQSTSQSDLAGAIP
ncbi:hypothetical protein DY000_02002989 [Brassica cretica]|uniref:Uncharacterized protein n=1 Tax=Brassica cretica TaxID=69181 RepID=A0ABQ7CHD1_BRACR|nr:hypothetical protein DY000_02002989 [Brassica cretica]